MYTNNKLKENKLNINLTDEQQKIADHIKEAISCNKTENIVISACAGASM